MMERASRESRRTGSFAMNRSWISRNDHESSGHLDPYASNPSSSERFDETMGILCDCQPGTEVTAWHKAALELNQRLIAAQLGATESQVKSTQATGWATYALVAATFFLALSSIIQAVALAVYSSGI